MPGPSDKQPPRRAPTFGGEDDRRNHRRSPTAGTIYAPSPEIPEEITGRYEGDLLAQKRGERSDRERLAILEHKADRAERLEEQVAAARDAAARHDEAYEWLAPIAREMPGKLGDISAGLKAIAGDVDGVADTMRAHVESMTQELRGIANRLSLVERKSDADAARLELVERTAKEHAAELEQHRGDLAKLKRARERERDRAATSTDVKIGGFVRRHAAKALLVIAAAVGSAIAGGVSGYLFGSREPAPVLPVLSPAQPVMSLPPKGAPP